MKLDSKTIGGIIVGTILVLVSLLYVQGCDSLGFVSHEKTEQLRGAVDEASIAKADAEKRAGKAATVAGAAQQQSDALKSKRKAITGQLAAQYQALAGATDEERGAIDASIEALKVQLDGIKGAEDRANQSLAAALAVQSDAIDEAEAFDAAIARADAEIEALAAQQQEAIGKLPALMRTVGSSVGAFVPGAGAIGDQAAQGLGGIIGILAGGATGIGGLLAARRKAKETGALQRAIGITEKIGFDRITTDPAARAAAKAAMAADPEAFRAFNGARMEAKRDMAMQLAPAATPTASAPAAAAA